MIKWTCTQVKSIFKMVPAKHRLKHKWKSYWGIISFISAVNLNRFVRMTKMTNRIIMINFLVRSILLMTVWNTINNLTLMIQLTCSVVMNNFTLFYLNTVVAVPTCREWHHFLIISIIFSIICINNIKGCTKNCQFTNGHWRVKMLSSL